MTMIFNISNEELRNNKLLKDYDLTIWDKKTDYSVVFVSDNDYYQIRVNLGGDSLDNPRFKVIDYGSAGIVYKMGVGQVNKRFIGRRDDNYQTKALDSLRQVMQEEQFDLINYSEGYADFNYISADKLLDYIIKADITCYVVTKYRWGVRVSF